MQYHISWDFKLRFSHVRSTDRGLSTYQYIIMSVKDLVEANAIARAAFRNIFHTIHAVVNFLKKHYLEYQLLSSELGLYLLYRPWLICGLSSKSKYNLTRSQSTYCLDEVTLLKNLETYQGIKQKVDAFPWKINVMLYQFVSFLIKIHWFFGNGSRYERK